MVVAAVSMQVRTYHEATKRFVIADVGKLFYKWFYQS